MAAIDIGKALKQAEVMLRKAGVPLSRLEAEVLLAACMGWRRHQLWTHSCLKISETVLSTFNSFVARRLQGEPVAYILGKKEFWSLEFIVNRSVLIPRPETEILIAAILKRHDGKDCCNLRILEIGTGSGAIAVVLAKELAGAWVVATDCSLHALRVACQNACVHGVAERIAFVCADLFEPLKGMFDVIVSNPPYLTEAEFRDIAVDISAYEPRGALVAGPEGLEFYRKIIGGAEQRLKAGGWLAMEIGSAQEEAVTSLVRKTLCFRAISCEKDYAGLPRVVLAQRI